VISLTNLISIPIGFHLY